MKVFSAAFVIVMCFLTLHSISTGLCEVTPHIAWDAMWVSSFAPSAPVSLCTDPNFTEYGWRDNISSSWSLWCHSIDLFFFFSFSTFRHQRLTCSPASKITSVRFITTNSWSSAHNSVTRAVWRWVVCVNNVSGVRLQQARSESD